MTRAFDRLWPFALLVVLAGGLAWVLSCSTARADSLDGGTVVVSAPPVVQPLPAPDGGVQQPAIPTAKLALQVNAVAVALAQLQAQLGMPTVAIPPSFWQTPAGITVAVIVSLVTAGAATTGTILGALQAAK